MRRRLAPCLTLALAVAGCSRDLAVPPKPSIAALGVLPSFQSVAPREPVTFRGTGGVAPYTFAFAQGGQLSGSDASLTAAGAYVAGSNGSAQDVVEVTDARGTTATATVSVGQRIAITPSLTGTVPGGRISFQATGGSGTYTFTIGTAGSGGDVTPLDGVYTAGAVGDTIDTVLVTDDYAAAAKAEIHVGQQLQLYRSDTRPVAPRESVTIIALGGQPPYRYSVDLPGPYDPAVDATILANGVYTAGSRVNDPSLATTTDTIRVADSANVPQHAALTIQVGPRLRLALDSTEVFPGRPAQLVASGGKPPYTFGFAARVPASATGPGADPRRVAGGNGGNRSAGVVNAFTGEYVPGFSPGAVDWFQVGDATSAPAAVLEGPRVGALPLAIGSGVRDCFAGDFSGDGSEDVLFSMSGDNSTRVVAGLMLDSTTPWLQSYFLPWGGLAGFVADFAKTGRASVAFTGGDLRCDGAPFCQNPDFWALAPDLAGYLSVQQLAGGGPQQYLEVYNDPPYQNATGTAFHRETTNWGIRLGTGRLDAPGGAWQFWGMGWDADTVQTSVWSPGPARCTSAFGTPGDAWFLRMDWKVGDPRPARPVCEMAQGFCPTCTPTTWHQPIALAVGDFDGDAYLDLAYILDTDNNRNATGPTAQLYLARGTAGGFAPPVEGWPGDAWSFGVDDRGTYRARFQVVRPPGATVDALLLRLVDTTTRRGRLFLVGGGDPTALDAWNVWLDPNPLGAGVEGFSAAPEDPSATARAGAVTSGSFYAWSGNDGVVTGFALSSGPSGATFTPGTPAATLPFAVNAVCLPDVNADGIPDLVAASDLGATAQLVLGDGATGAAASGTFGALTHQRGLAFPVVAGDFDGDGFLDAVVANLSGAGVSVLWGGGGMLAWGAQISSASISAATGGDYTGEGWPSVLVQEKSGRFDVIRSRNDGTFDPAVALTGYAATGGPAEASFFAWPVDLNTARPGIDAMTFGQKGGGMVPRALLVQQGRVVDVAAKPIPQIDAIHVRAQDCWALRIGKAAELPAHTAAVVAGCGHSDNTEARNVFAVWGTTISNVDAAPALDGTQPAFGDWVLVTSTSVSPDPAYSATVAGGGRLRTTMVGTVDLTGLTPRDPGTAVFAFATDRLYVVEVSTNGLAADPRSWTATVFPVTPRTSDFYPFLAKVGRVDADPATWFHAVVGGGNPAGGISGGGSLVLRRTATGYEVVQRLGSGGFPVGIGKLTDGSPGDAVFFVGDWANAGLVPEIVVRLNDGTGVLR